MRSPAQFSIVVKLLIMKNWRYLFLLSLLIPIFVRGEPARTKLLNVVASKADPLATQCQFDPPDASIHGLLQEAKASKSQKDICIGMGTLDCSLQPCEQLKRYGHLMQEKIRAKDSSLEGYFKIYMCHTGPNKGKIPSREVQCPEVLANDDYHPFVLCIGKAGGTASKRTEARCP